MTSIFVIYVSFLALTAFSNNLFSLPCLVAITAHRGKMSISFKAESFLPNKKSGDFVIYSRPWLMFFQYIFRRLVTYVCEHTYGRQAKASQCVGDDSKSHHHHSQFISNGYIQHIREVRSRKPFFCSHVYSVLKRHLMTDTVSFFYECSISEKSHYLSSSSTEQTEMKEGIANQ